MPVAALIVVGPGIEVKTVESNSLRTDCDLGKLRTNVAVGAIFVHAEVCGGVTHSNEARQQPGWLGKQAHCSGSERAAKLFWIIYDLDEPVVPAVQGQVATHGNYPRDVQESQFGFRAIFSGTRPKHM